MSPFAEDRELCATNRVRFEFGTPSITALSKVVKHKKTLFFKIVGRRATEKPSS